MNIQLFENEYFIPLKGFEKTYQISNFGRVYSNYQKGLMKFDRKDYYTLSMGSNKNKRFHIYDLMSFNFIEDIVNYYKSFVNRDTVDSINLEVWKDVVGYEGSYQVSNLGRVKSLKRKTRTWIIHKEIIMHPKEIEGYLQIGLSKNAKKLHTCVHRLVAEAFIPNPKGFPQVNHINANRSDNKVENLEWCTQSQNLRHAYKMGNKDQRGEKNNNAKINQQIANEIREYYKENNHLAQWEVGKVFGVSREIVKCIVNNKNWNY